MGEKGGLARAQQNQGRRAQNPGPDGGELQILPVQGNVYLVAGAGGNITVLTGREGILIECPVC
jgi:hypothetical protein